MAKESPRWFFHNWRESDASVAEKARRVVANNLRKARTGQRCCGNHGDPGC
jgi:hypothetical protein